MSKDAQDSREKILNVAERIFAQKGFDGARVDEIAREAGVNKALIYYYFKSKKDILESLFLSLINDVKMIIERVGGEIVGLSDEGELDKALDYMLDFVLAKRDIIRIALIESLKSSSENSIMIKIAEIIMSGEIEEIRNTYKEKGASFPGDEEQLMVTEFFTGILPVVNFVMFKDELGSYFGIDQEEIRQKFIAAYKMTHIAYHMGK